MSDIYIGKSRLTWLDALKGVFMLLVVYMHSCTLRHDIIPYLIAGYMQAFFVASGYTFNPKPGAVQRKFLQLVKPYIFWVSFYVILQLIFYTNWNLITFDYLSQKLFGCLYSRFSLFPLGTKNNIFFLPRDAGPLWFLTCMALGFVLSAPLVRASSKKTAALLACFYMLVSVVLSHAPILLPWSIDTAFVAAILIWIGYLLKKISINKKRALIALLLCLSVYIPLVSYNGGVNMSVGKYGKHDDISVLFFVLIGVMSFVITSSIFIVFEKNYITRLFSCVGRYSLIIMCAHKFFLSFMNQMYTCCEKYDLVKIDEYSWIFIRLFLVVILCIALDVVLKSILGILPKLFGYSNTKG